MCLPWAFDTFLSSVLIGRYKQEFFNVSVALIHRNRYGIRGVVEGTVRSLHPIVQDEAYRIGREALVNAFAHAHGGAIDVEICYSAKELRIRIQDDGCGIDSAVLASGGKFSHWGMRGMIERAKKIHARLDISSRVGGGTEIELVVPGAVAFNGARRRPDRSAELATNGTYHR